MKKVLLTLLIVLLLVVFFATWLWKLGAPPTLASSTARLEQVTGQVEVRTTATDTWTPATEGQELTAGTQVRTGETGSVTLSISGVSQTRLATSTEVSVDALVLPQGDSLKSQMSLTLTGGRIWSRIVRVLELDSAYTVKTDDVVATVRGTAFETTRNKQGETWVAVYEGTVKAQDRTTSKALPKGTGLRAVRGTMRFVTSTTTIPQNTPWMKKNLEADTEFLKTTQTNLQRELIKDSSGKMFEMLGKPAERLRMALADDKEKLELADKYMSRRMALAKQWEEQGQDAKARTELEQLKTEMVAWQATVATDMKDQVFQRALIQGSLLFHDATAESPAHFLKDGLENLKNNLPLQPPQLLPDLKMDPTTNIKVDSTAPRAPVDDAKVLLDRTTQPTSNQQTVPTPPPTIDTKAVLDAQPATLTPTGLILSAPNVFIPLKNRLPLTAVALFSNGTRTDVTAQTTFVSSDPALALMNDNIVQATDIPGRVQVTASFRQNGVSVTDSLTLSIQP